MKVFLTGADGFVGRHLSDHVVASGDEIVTSVERCDITDRVALHQQLASAQPDVIYHLAALTSVADSWRDPVSFTRVNLVGTTNVLDAAHDTVPSATVIVVSSAEVYGVVDEGDLPLVETFRTAPANPYSTSKVEAEHYAREVAHARGQRIIIARPFNHVGPGQSTKFFLPALVERLLRARATGQSDVAVGNLASRRDFSDVRDVVRAYRLLSLFGKAGEVYNVASGHDESLAELAEYLRLHVAPDTHYVADPELFRPLDIPVTRGSAHKLHEATGWEPTWTLEQSLTDVIADVTDRFLAA